MPRAAVFPLACLMLGCAPLAAQLPSLTVTPASVSFTFTIGDTKLPAPQTLQVKRSGSGAALDFTTTVTPVSPWLIVTPTSGKTGTPVSVRVNPTSLIAGTYAATLEINSSQASGPVAVSVILVIKNPPPTMAVSPASLTFAWQTDASSPPASQLLTVTTNGEPLSFTATAAGGTWLSVSPTVGVALSGSPVPLTVAADTTGMFPGTYTGKITLASPTAANKTVTVGVSLTVTPGKAVLTSIWPSAAPVGSNDTTITIRGSHLFKASVVKAGTTDLTATWISTDVLLAVIPKALLGAQGTLPITVVNSPQPASNALNFTVTPPGPTIQTVVNAASFTNSTPTPVLAPGEIISIFGAGLGPSTPILATPSGNAFPTTLGTPAAVVEFEIPPNSNTWVAAPLIFIQANQINCQVPFGLPAGTAAMRVIYNNLTSSVFTFDGVAAAPGLFTVDSSGRGQAAALNYNPTTQTYALNSASNPVAKGGIVVLYLTGGGAINPLPNPDGALSGSNPLPALTNTPSVTIGGEAASVLSATAVPGALGGLIQLNVSVPNSVKAGKDLPVVVTIAGRSTPATATIAVK